MEEILKELAEGMPKTEEIEWIEEQEVMDWLKISRSTLYRWRSARIIMYSKMGKRPLYPKQLIQKYIVRLALR